MRLSLDATQAEFDAWHAERVARVQSDSDYLRVDLNDGILMFATARALASERPELRELLLEWTPEAVELAEGELGMVMGSHWLGRKVGLDGEVVWQRMLRCMTRWRYVDVGGDRAVVFPEGEAPGAWLNGTRVVKVAEDKPNEGTPLGTKGSVLSSLRHTETGEIMYFVEWDTTPGVPVGVVAWKLELAP